MGLQRIMANQIKIILLGGASYVCAEDLLDFLENRVKLVTRQMLIRGTPLADTEFLRGQYFEQENIKHAISTPTQVS